MLQPEQDQGGRSTKKPKEQRGELDTDTEDEEQVEYLAKMFGAT